MSQTNEPKMAEPVKPGAAAPAGAKDGTAEKPKSHEPVVGVTLFDRVFSWLLTIILIVGPLAGALAAVWLSNKDWNWSNKAAVQMDMVEFIEDVEGGGTEDGELGSSLFLPGPVNPNEEASTAVDQDVIISDSQPMEQQMSAVLNAVGVALENPDTLMMTADIGTTATPSGSKGTGRKRNLGKGPGDGGGVKRAERWEIVFDQGQTVAEYAKQLDFFNVKLGVIVSGQLYKVSKLASNKPAVEKLASSAAEKELYFSWRGGNRRQYDIDLVKKCSEIPLAGTVIVLQFYPQDTEQKLARMERDYLEQKKGTRELKLVRKTRFGVITAGGGYDFQIGRQEYFGDPPGKS